MDENRPSRYPVTCYAGGAQAVYDDAADKAAFLSDLGMNLNHAPMADVSGPDGFIYPRTYGGEGLYNARFVAEAVRGHEGNGVSRLPVAAAIGGRCRLQRSHPVRLRARGVSCDAISGCGCFYG